MPTVRERTFDILRATGMTTMFGNPGSTEIPLLCDLPSDLRYVLALHEGAVVSIATGHAIATGRAALVNLHTVAGLGNAVNAIANARDCRTPLVVLVGQQDRRQLSFRPFLTGRGLESLAGEYPVWTSFPAIAADVPGTIARAKVEAEARRGPALVVVPMDDWEQPVGAWPADTPAHVAVARAVTADDVAPLADALRDARAPAIVVGSGTDSDAGFAALVALAERLSCPVWQEPFTHRVGFPQDHPQFAGHFAWRRAQMRETLRDHDVVFVVGSNAFRLYLLDDPGPPVPDGTQILVLSDDADEVHRSPAHLGLIAPVAEACAALAAGLEDRHAPPLTALRRPDPPPPPAPDEPLLPAHVMSALAARLPPDAILVEETPSSQPELYRRIVIRRPLGFVAGANGGLGFGIAGAIGLRMALPERPVVAVLGDGSSLYGIQALWSAARYEVGVLFVVLANRRYAVMDGLADARGEAGPWPSFGEVDLTAVALGLGCQARRVSELDQLESELDTAVGELARRTQPLLLEVAVGR